MPASESSGASIAPLLGVLRHHPHGAAVTRPTAVADCFTLVAAVTREASCVAFQNQVASPLGSQRLPSRSPLASPLPRLLHHLLYHREDTLRAIPPPTRTASPPHSLTRQLLLEPAVHLAK